jgi:DNA-binding XRE family transcriptional regulator
MDKEKLEAYIQEHTKIKDKSLSFVRYLYKMMDKYEINNPADLYNKANVSRQLWSSIISEKSNPSLNVCLKIVFALKLTNAECKLLLKKAGFTLASASKYSLIIRYFIEHNNYDLNELNGVLEEYGYTNSLIF